MATPALPALGAAIEDAQVVRVDPSRGGLLALPVAFGSSPTTRTSARSAARRPTPPTARDDDAAAAKGPEMPLTAPVHASACSTGARASTRRAAKQFPEGARALPRRRARRVARGWLASVAPATLEATVLRVADVRPADVPRRRCSSRPAGAEVSLGGVRAHRAPAPGDTAKHAASKALLASARRSSKSARASRAARSSSTRSATASCSPRSRRSCATRSRLRARRRSARAAASRDCPARARRERRDGLRHARRRGDGRIVVLRQRARARARQGARKAPPRGGPTRRRRAAAPGARELAAAYEMGQVVQCVIVKCDAERSPPRLVLSFDVAGATIGGDARALAAAGGAADGAGRGVRDGDVVRGVVSARRAHRRPRARCSSGAPATLAACQLGDHGAAHGEDLARARGRRRARGPARPRGRRAHRPRASRASPRSCARPPAPRRRRRARGAAAPPRAPRERAELAVGQLVVGVVRSVRDFGVFVRPPA